jgi:hypothetical protein
VLEHWHNGDHDQRHGHLLGDGDHGGGLELQLPDLGGSYGQRHDRQLRGDGDLLKCHIYGLRADSMHGYRKWYGWVQPVADAFL